MLTTSQSSTTTNILNFRSIIPFMMRRKLSKVTPDTTTMITKRQRTGSIDSTCTSSTISSHPNLTTKKNTAKTVHFFPMVMVQEVRKYSETEKKDIFLSRDDLQQIKEREMMCVACKTKPALCFRLLSNSSSWNDDVECVTVMSIEEMKLRKKIRQAVVRAVLHEQQIHRYLGVTEPVWGLHGCKPMTAVAGQQALQRGQQAEIELRTSLCC